MLSVSGVGAIASEPGCASADIRVEGGEASNRRHACVAAADALEFLAARGLSYEGAVAIRLVHHLPASDPGTAIAVYDQSRNEIRVIDYETVARAARTKPLKLWREMSPEFWRSFVAHEVAHMVANVHFAPDVPRFTATEYLGCVTQMSTLPAPLREKMLRHYAGQSRFADIAAISVILYMIDPSAFTVRAYRHFSELDDAPRFLRWLLENGAPADYDFR